MGTSRRMLVVGAAASAVLAAAGCGNGLLSEGSETQDDGPIVLGMLVPQSGSEASIGPYMENAARLAVDEINDAGGVLGRELELKVADDGCDPQTAVSAANRLIADGVDISVGGYCSGATLPTLTVFGDADVPMIIPAANSQELVEQGLRHVFLINGTGSQQADAAAAWIGELETDHVSIVHDNTSYSKDIAVRTEAALEGIDASMEVITPKESDYSANVTSIMKSGADAVYFTGYFQEAGLLTRQLRQAGYDGDVIVADGAVSPKLAEIAGEHAEGVYATMTQTPETLTGAEDWLAAYEERFSAKPGPFSSQSYDGVRLAAEAIEVAGSTDTDDVIAALEGIDGFELFSGPLKFTDEHTLTTGGFQILVNRDGEFVLQDDLQ